MVKSLWTSKEIAQACAGVAETEFEISGTVHIDSRKISNGDLFIAIEGPNNDGHKFLNQTVTAGSAGALVHKQSSVPAVVVENTFVGMQQLANASVSRSGAKRIAVTGSVGKTGTKELLAAGFAAVGQTHATEGNLNNHFGLPLTLSRMPRETDFAILELGMDHAGEISALTAIAKPHVAIITRIAKVHMEFFDSIDDIALAKAEIFEGVVEGGTAILNMDDPFFDLLCSQAQKLGANIYSFGTNPKADACLLSTQAGSKGGQKVEAKICGKLIGFDLSMNGGHYGLSALAVLLAADVLKQDMDKVAAALKNVKPLAGRGEMSVLTDEVLLIDESYNANPVAMNASFDVLMHLSDARKNGRTVAILGDMLELGSETMSMHADLGASLVAKGVDVVYCCGPLMLACSDYLSENSELLVEHFENSENLATQIHRLIQGGDTVLVKGSLGSAMAKICVAIKDKFAA